MRAKSFFFCLPEKLILISAVLASWFDLHFFLVSRAQITQLNNNHYIWQKHLFFLVVQQVPWTSYLLIAMQQKKLSSLVLRHFAPFTYYYGT